jgi:hypothetical protein
MLPRLLLGCLFTTSLAQASIVPRSEHPVKLIEERSNGMTEETFNRVLDQIEQLYGHTIFQLGGDLSLQRYWSSSSVDAHSIQVNSKWIIRIFGGLARHPEMTPDGLALVVCHEIGHHLAGFPQLNDWSASEGNADYFATQTCLKKLWGKDTTGFGEPLPSRPAALCSEQSIWGGSFCARAMQASFRVASFLASLEGATIDWNQPDSQIVSQTNLGYPTPQCRLDTFVAGTLCERPSTENLIPWNEKELAASSCHPSRFDRKGLRPSCWFKSHLSP